MIRVSLLFLLMLMASCQNKQLKAYEAIVDFSDSAVIVYGESDTVSISKDRLENFKDILKRNIEPESPRKFLSNESILLFNSDKKIAALHLSQGTNKPYVNFQSGSVNFTFRLTYGIGMTVDDYINTGDLTSPQ